MRYYMYRHVDPDTGETVYAGKGSAGRAWDVTRNRTGNTEHLAWCLAWCDLGYTPNKYVIIDYQGLTALQALSLEKEYLHTNGCPRFNRQSGERNYQAKLTDEQAREIFLRTRNKEPHQLLAKEFNVSRSAISMISSRRQWRAATACLITPN